MNEHEVVDQFSFQDCKQGLETLDRLAFSEYQEVCKQHINPPTEDGVEARLNELEQAMTAIRCIQSILDQVNFTESEIQNMVGDLQTKTGSSEEIIETVEFVTELLKSE